MNVFSREYSVTAIVLLAFLFGAVLNGCAPKPEPAVPTVPVEPSVQPPEDVSPMQAVDWSEVDGWAEDDPSLALGALLQSCVSLRWRDGWQEVCALAAALDRAPASEVRNFFETYFQPHQLRQEDGSSIGMLTGYYVPDLQGSRIKTPTYAYPLYRRPSDLLTIDLSHLYPSLANYRLRGRVEGTRVIPYWDRAEIDGPDQPLAGEELFWVNDPVELFFLHIQGSGRILLEDGRAVMVNYADQNGHPYRSIGKWMIEHGIMSRDQMSMQNIRSWARNNPEQTAELLAQNPSYVFFREMGEGTHSPPGALGVPLTPGRSLAVDPRYIPLGVPVFLATTWPESERPLRRLMLAQDTGGAIKGRVRADFFWGMGEQAGAQAGRMKQDVRLWVLLPREQ